MPRYKVEGKANTKKGQIGVMIFVEAPNEKVARVKATEDMHIIEKVKKA